MYGRLQRFDLTRQDTKLFQFCRAGGQGGIWGSVEGVPHRAEWRSAFPVGLVPTTGFVQVGFRLRLKGSHAYLSDFRLQIYLFVGVQACAY